VPDARSPGLNSNTLKMTPLRHELDSLSHSVLPASSGALAAVASGCGTRLMIGHLASVVLAEFNLFYPEFVELLYKLSPLIP
jgi:hypothetical protein